MKTMTKVIAVMMMMTFTTTAMANSDKNTRPVVSIEIGVRPNGHHSGSTWHNAAPAPRSWHQSAAKPTLRTYTFQVSSWAASHKNVVAAANSVKGVKVTNWNPRTRQLTVSYDARLTTPSVIRGTVE